MSPRRLDNGAGRAGNGTPPPIFVVGFQRSGTTLLQSMLGAHPNIAAPPEMHYLFRVAHLADYFGDLHEDDRLRLALHEALHPRIPLLAECGFDEDELFEQARRCGRSYAGLLDVILTDFAHRRGKRRWSEKTPDQPAGAIRRLFPEAQLVHIVRDPRDVVASRLETPWEERRARQLAVAWRWFTLDAISAGGLAGPSRFLQVRYEDLTADPEAVMRLVCCFVREDYDPGMVDSPELRTPTVSSAAAPWQSGVLQPITTARHGRYRASLRPSQRASIAAVVHRALPILGYPPARRTEVALGRLAKVASSPARMTRALPRLRIRTARLTPEDRYVEARQFAEDAAARIPSARGEKVGGSR